jgi:DNA-binding PadR family transcriptional regulator
MAINEPSRITKPTLKVVAFLLTLNGKPTWGIQICGATDLGSGSVYAVLDRFESYGWMESNWEEDNQRKGARRRLYSLTQTGKREIQNIAKEHLAEPSKDPKVKTMEAKYV